MAQDGKDTPPASRRVVIVGPDTWSMIRLREGLIRSLAARRHRVLCLTPEASEAERTALRKLGAEWAAWAPRTGAIDVLAHRRSVDDLTRLLGEHRPYAVIGYGVMPMLIATLAGRRAGAARVVPLVTGLPGLSQPGVQLGWSLKRLALAAFRAADALICHNRHDADKLQALRLLPPKLPVHVVPGGGVDLARFAAAPLPAFDRGLVFAMIARLDRGKGVLEFCEAARRIKLRSELARFVLAGPPGPGPTGLTSSEVAMAAQGAVELTGEVDDVRGVLGGSHVYVLPSHQEGMPRTALEALAIGRPIITSNIPGARETVDERVNGVLVPPGDVDQLVAAMESFLKRPDLIASMARASRLKAERLYGADGVHATLLSVIVPAAAEGRVA